MNQIRTHRRTSAENSSVTQATTDLLGPLAMLWMIRMCWMIGILRCLRELRCVQDVSTIDVSRIRVFRRLAIVRQLSYDGLELGRMEDATEDAVSQRIE